MSKLKVNAISKSEQDLKQQNDEEYFRRLTVCIDQINNLIDYFYAFNQFHEFFLSAIADTIKSFSARKTKINSMVNCRLQVYLNLYGLLIDEYDYRILFDAEKPTFFFNRSYHNDYTYNLEYLLHAYTKYKKSFRKYPT
jgi:hypothetical protein